MKHTAWIVSAGMIYSLVAMGCATSRAGGSDADRSMAQQEILLDENRQEMPSRLDTTTSEVDREIDAQARRLPTEPVDLNTATFEELKRIPGVDDQLARQIFAYRSKAGRFYSVDQLLQVKGMDPERLEQVRQWVSVGGTSRETPARPPSEKPDMQGPSGVVPEPGRMNESSTSPEDASIVPPP